MMSPKLVDSLKLQKKVVMKLLVPYKIPLSTNLNGLNKCLRCALEYKASLVKMAGYWHIPFLALLWTLA